ncbi:MAG: hypothetical protein HOL85_16030, partial [Rhodospirillaceae bacterium]|nr:hypothetical protein [Rhodospirillaceae bacterium]
TRLANLPKDLQGKAKGLGIDLPEIGKVGDLLKGATGGNLLGTGTTSGTTSGSGDSTAPAPTTTDPLKALKGIFKN